MPRINDERPAYRLAPASFENYQPNELYKTPAWRKLRVIHLRANPLCAACEARGILTDCTKYRKGAIDHVISIRLGGALLHPLNLMTLCASCHARKSKLERDGLALPFYGEEGERMPGMDGKQKAIEAINKTTTV